MSNVLKEVLAANQKYSEGFGNKSALALPPARRFAILTCMDARLDPAKYAGLAEGDAHVIRNAGGRASDDAIRSLVISYKLLGTREWFVIHHTDCGMLTFTDDALRAQIAVETGFKPPYALNAFDDLAADVRAGIARIKADPHLLHHDRVRGFIFDVATGRLNEVL